MMTYKKGRQAIRLSRVGFVINLAKNGPRNAPAKVLIFATAVGYSYERRG